MFDYFKNYSSNAHQVRCEDSPTKGLYMTIANPMILTFIQGDKCIPNLTPFKLAITRTIFMLLHSNFGMAVDFWMPYYDHIPYYAHARFDDLDLDARSQWVDTGKKSSLHTLGN